MTEINDHLSARTESVFVIPGEISPDTVTNSLQALLSTRHCPIARRRFTVLDTFDGRVRKAQACLIHSGVNGSSTMSWQSGGGMDYLSTRVEHPANFAWDLPDGPLQDTVAEVIGPRRLLAQADAEEQGSALDVIDDRGKTVARLRISSGRARRSEHSDWQSLPVIVTLSGLCGYEEVYRRLVPVIESRPGIERCGDGLVGVILGRVGTSAPVDSSHEVDLAADVSADAGARRIHSALVAVLEANEAGLRANLDTEFLHDFRVAVRRTRSLLTQIRNVFPAARVEHFAAEFSWIGRFTGPPRDIDVLALTIRERRADFEPAEIEALVALLGDAQQREHHALVAALDSDRYRQLLADWKAFLAEPLSPEHAGPNAAAPLAVVVSKRAWRLSGRIASRAATVDDRTPADHLHEIRIDAKKLRYLVDIAPAFYERDDLNAIVGALKKLQRVLGDFNDAHVQERKLVECAQAVPPGNPAVAVLLGRLIEQTRQRGRQLRGDIPETLGRFCARDIHSACRRAFRKTARQELAR